VLPPLRQTARYLLYNLIVPFLFLSFSLGNAGFLRDKCGQCGLFAGL